MSDATRKATSGEGRGRATVVIAAYKAQDFVGHAVRSALEQTERPKVIVVDDASPDDTAVAARACDDGSGRLTVLRQARNEGPAAARNRAIAAATSPWIALLDADDRMAPDRLQRLIDRAEARGWDVAADDILKLSDWDRPEAVTRLWTDDDFGEIELDLARFTQENMQRVAGFGRELGFTKPVMRRAFLLEKGLTYDERLRLGEDFNLYARALAARARFGLVDPLGYFAFDTPGSLSKRHDGRDLKQLYLTTKEIARGPGVDAAAAAALSDYLREARKRWTRVRLIEAWKRRDALDFLACFTGPPSAAGAAFSTILSRFGPPSRP